PAAAARTPDDAAAGPARRGRGHRSVRRMLGVRSRVPVPRPGVGGLPARPDAPRGPEPLLPRRQGLFDLHAGVPTVPDVGGRGERGDVRPLPPARGGVRRPPFGRAGPRPRPTRAGPGPGRRRGVGAADLGPGHGKDRGGRGARRGAACCAGVRGARRPRGVGWGVRGWGWVAGSWFGAGAAGRGGGAGRRRLRNAREGAGGELVVAVTGGRAVG